MYPIATLCRLFGFSKQAFLKNVEEARMLKIGQEAFAVEFILRVRSKDSGIGGRKLWHMYAREFKGNAPLGRDRFEAVVDKYGLKTDSRHGLPLYPNLIKTFVPTAP